MRILITGGQGQLASALKTHPLAQSHHIFATDHRELDISDQQTIINAITHLEPEIIINCAAYTAVDKAETESELAFRTNTVGPENLAKVCKKSNIPLFHISTDYVFAGSKTTPYLENDSPQPLNIYGQSKWQGEEAIRNNWEKHLILRVSAVFSTVGQNFVKTILRLAQEKETLRIVADQTTCPTFTDDVAHTLYTLCSTTSDWGTYHYCGTEAVTWHQFASAIIDEAKNHTHLSVKEITAIATKDYPTPAKRPIYSVLDCHKIKAFFAIKQPSWRTGLKQVLSQLHKGHTL